VKPQDIAAEFDLVLCEGVEGLCVYLNDFRIAGPKPWGGGRTVRSWKVSADDIRRSGVLPETGEVCEAPVDVCLQRATEVIEWGGEPYCQPFLEKTALDRNDYVVKYDWTHDKLTHFARYFNRFLWKYTPLDEYRCGTKQPFAMVG
jgi:hypothetical protein